MRSLLTCIVASLFVVHCGGESGDESAADVDALKALPYLDFSEAEVPQETGVVLWDKERAGDGYNLFVTRRFCRADLIDMAGNLKRTWREEDCHHWGNADLLENGDLLVVGTKAKQADDDRETILELSYLRRMSWDGEVIWTRQTGAHHDIEWTPDGDIVTLTNVWRSLPEIHAEHAVRDQGVALYAPDGELIRELSLYDIIERRPEVLPFETNAPRGRFTEQEIDLLHVNTVEWMDEPAFVERHPLYGLDNILITSRNQNSVLVVNWKTEELVWAWGQGEISGPHGGTVLDDGNILIFDNGLGREWSRVVEIEPLSGEIVWQWSAPEPTDFHTRDQGAAQRLPNGNTLMTESGAGRVLEITPEGEVVWKFVGPITNEEGQLATIVRMLRYDKAFIEGLPVGGATGSD